MTDLSTAQAKEPTPPWALAAASHLARYSGNTLATYSISLRLVFTWCLDHGLDPLEAKRVHLELSVRYLEHDRGTIPHCVAHHLTPLVGYYRFALIDGWIEKDPTAALRRPRVFIDESRILALDRDELRRLIAAARASNPTELALIAMLGLLSLRISESMGALIEDLGTGPPESVPARRECGVTAERRGAFATTRRCGSSARAVSRRRSAPPARLRDAPRRGR